MTETPAQGQIEANTSASEVLFDTQLQAAVVKIDSKPNTIMNLEQVLKKKLGQLLAATQEKQDGNFLCPVLVLPDLLSPLTRTSGANPLAVALSAFLAEYPGKIVVMSKSPNVTTIPQMVASYGGRVVPIHITHDPSVTKDRQTLNATAPTSEAAAWMNTTARESGMKSSVTLLEEIVRFHAEHNPQWSVPDGDLRPTWLE